MAFATKTWGVDTIGFEDKYLSVEEVLKRSNLDYVVESQPVFLSDGTEVPKCRANVRTDNGDILSTTGNRYNILQNNESLSWFQSFIDNKKAYITNVGTLKGGQILFAQAKLCDNPVEITPNDAVEAHLTMLNSFDGSTSVFAGFFVKRIFCDNQLPFLKKSSSLLKFKHTKSVKLNLDQVENIMHVAGVEFLSTCDLYKQLASKRNVTSKDLRNYIKTVFGKEESQNSEEVEMRESRIETIETFYTNGRGAKETPDSMYKIFNAVNEYLNYETGRSADSRLLSLWNGVNANLNQRALNVALDMSR